MTFRCPCFPRRAVWFVALVALVVRLGAEDRPIPEAEAAEFGRTLAAQFSRGEVEAALQSFDVYALGARVLRGFELGDVERSQYIAGMRRSAGQSLVPQFKKWNSAHFVRSTVQDDERRVLLRFLSTDGNFTYFDFVCVRRKSGDLKTVDFFAFTTGELFSTTLHRMFLPVIAHQKLGVLERLLSSDRAFIDHLPTLQRAMLDLRDGQGRRASDALEGLPPEVKRMSFVFLARVQAAGTVDEARYLAVLDEWEKEIPRDPARGLASLNAHILRKNYAAALRTIDDLQRRTGPEAYSELLRARLLSQHGQPESALLAVHRAHELEPTLPGTFDAWFDIELQRKNWPGLVAALRAFEMEHPTADLAAVLAEDEVWAPFRESPEYVAWRAAKARR